MLFVALLFLSFPVFQGVIIEMLLVADVVLTPEAEVFLNASPWALMLDVTSKVVSKIINAERKDITKTNLLFIAYMFKNYLL